MYKILVVLCKYNVCLIGKCPIYGGYTEIWKILVMITQAL